MIQHHGYCCRQVKLGAPYSFSPRGTSCPVPDVLVTLALGAPHVPAPGAPLVSVLRDPLVVPP